MANDKINREILEFFEPYREIIKKLYSFSQSKIVGVIFLCLLLLLIFLFWYSVCFGGGAMKWGKSIEKYNHRMGTNERYTALVSSPIFLKIVASIFLFMTLTGFFAVLAAMYR